MVMTRRGQLPFTEFHNCLQYFQRKVFDPFLKDPCPSDEEANDDPCNYLRSLNLATTGKRPRFAAPGQAVNLGKKSQNSLSVNVQSSEII